MIDTVRLRVLIDTSDGTDVFRDLALPLEYTFRQLHNAITDAFDFDPSEMASFYMSNEYWDKGEEIPLMDVGHGERSPKTMDEVLLKEKINKEDQRLLYVFDFLLMWCFYIEVVDFESSDSSESFPKLLLSYGEAPDQHSKEPSDLFGAMPGMDLDDLGGDESDEGSDQDEDLI